MKRLFKCLIVMMILGLSISPVYARAGGGSSGGSSGSSSGGSSHSHPYHSGNSTPVGRLASYIGLASFCGGMVVFIVYKKRYKALSMHKEVKKQYPDLNEKALNQQVIDYYYAIQEAWAHKDMDTLKQYLTPNLYETWETKLNWWEYEGIENKISRIHLLKTIIVDYHEDYFVSYIEGKMHDQMVKNNEVISTNDQVFVEYWYFNKVDGKLYLDEIKQEDEVGVKPN